LKNTFGGSKIKNIRRRPENGRDLGDNWCSPWGGKEAKDRDLRQEKTEESNGVKGIYANKNGRLQN